MVAGTATRFGVHYHEPGLVRVGFRLAADPVGQINVMLAVYVYRIPMYAYAFMLGLCVDSCCYDLNLASGHLLLGVREDDGFGWPAIR